MTDEPPIPQVDTGGSNTAVNPWRDIPRARVDARRYRYVRPVRGRLPRRVAFWRGTVVVSEEGMCFQGRALRSRLSFTPTSNALIATGFLALLLRSFADGIAGMSVSVGAWAVLIFFGLAALLWIGGWIERTHAERQSVRQSLVIPWAHVVEWQVAPDYRYGTLVFDGYREGKLSTMIRDTGLQSLSFVSDNAAMLEKLTDAIAQRTPEAIRQDVRWCRFW